MQRNMNHLEVHCILVLERAHPAAKGLGSLANAAIFFQWKAGSLGLQPPPPLCCWWSMAPLASRLMLSDEHLLPV